MRNEPGSDYRANHDREFVKKYSRIEESRSHIAFPILLDILREIGAESILDFGAGDGKFLKSLVERGCFSRFAYFDISSAMRTAAATRLKSHEVDFYKTTLEIPPQAFDAVTMIAVWMELSTDAIVQETLDVIGRSLRDNGSLIAVVTHPCFREQKYSTFQAHFDNMNYFDEGKRFEVDVFDNNKSVTFRDYHWNFDAMTRQASDQGFLLKRMYELPERDAQGMLRRGSPWAVLHFVRGS